VLRVNGVDTQWFSDDMAVLKSVKPNAVLLPKVETPETIIQVQALLDEIDKSGEVKIWAMLETVKAVVNAASIANCKSSCARFESVCIGNNDLAREAGMRVTSDRSVLIPWLMNFVAVSKASGLNILDGVYNDFSDLEGFGRECEQGASMGMSGKTLIHPKQIDIANLAYSPSATDIEKAQRIVNAFADEANDSVGVLQIDGRMVERLHLTMAQHTLSIAERINKLT